MKTIIIAGGSGFLGQVLEVYFNKRGYTINILTRHPKRDNDIYWNAKDLGPWTKALEDAEALINLTGESVDCRYTETNKKLIHDSRIDATHVLGLAINLCENPPKTWMNSSTATIYKGSLDKEMTEAHGDIGDDFSMNIAKSWESAFRSITTPKTRKIVLRTAIVLGKTGGALIPLKKLTLFGLGGKQGSGNQKVSWIHDLDFARAVAFLMNNKNLKGAFNLCVPKPTNNNTLMKALRTAIGIPFGIPNHNTILALGAKLIGTETELVLKSRNVIPERLMAHGFTFKFTKIESAMRDLIN